jgi:DNA-binding XRE family transcriptional regulator
VLMLALLATSFCVRLWALRAATNFWFMDHCPPRFFGAIFCVDRDNYSAVFCVVKGVIFLPFIERLKSCRQEKKLSQRQVAIDTDVSPRAYQYYEAGSSEPTIGVVIALARYFDVSIDYLVGESDDPARR